MLISFPQKRAMNRMKRRLTPEEEDHMVEWLKQNEFLYDKTSERFKMTNQKQKMWADKEEELGGLNPGDLVSTNNIIFKCLYHKT